MSRTVDERIVEMRFDNKQFENNVQTSLSTIDKLKQSLNFTGASKGLDKVSSAASNINMSGLGSAVETVRSKFSALEVMGVTALANITNSAVNAGKRIVSALTIDPIKSGFQEYETQINAVQTILANTSSKGKTIEDVNGALDELNAYADKTIYNFTEMTRNIGTFTAAGVDLDTSVAAIKGIANLAAVSGSTSQQASTAMYQLSQALASGTVKLMDWNSVVNAGMGGQVFQDALKDTARVHGIAIDDMIDKAGSFRETLQNGWLTSEILTETLSKFTGDLTEKQLKTMGYSKKQIASIMEMGKTANDAATKVKTFTQLFDTLKEAAQSGWTQSWEIIVGDFEEAKELLTEVSDIFGGIIGASAEARNEMLQGWKDLGGRTVLIEGVRNAFYGIMEVITPIKEAFREIFPPITSEQLFKFTEGFKKLTENFKIGETTATNLKRTFKGVFAILDMGIQAIKALFNGFSDLTKYISPAGKSLLDYTANLGDYLVGLRDSANSTDAFNKAVAKTREVISTTVVKVRDAIGIAIDRFKEFAVSVKSFVTNVADTMSEIAKIDTSGVEAFTDKLKLRFEPLTALGLGVKKVFGGFLNFIKKVAPIFYALASKIGEAFGGLSDKIVTAINNAEFDSLLDLINTGLFGGLLFGIKKFIDNLSSVTESAGGFLESITGILDGVKGSLEAYQSSLKANTLLKIAGAIAILAAALIAMSIIDSSKLTMALQAMTTMFVELFGSMAAFEKIMGSDGFNSMGKVTTAMLGISVAVLILSVAISKLAQLDYDGITKGLFAVSTLSAALVISAKSLSKSSGKLIKGATGLIVFATAILILAEAVKKLGALDTKSLAKGLVGVGVLCAELALFLKGADLDKMGVLKGVGLIALAAAVNILADAVGKFGALDVNSLIKGLAGVGIVLTELALFVNATGNAKKVVSTAIGLTIVGAAMLIFAKAVGNMGALSLEEIGKGLLTMAGSLAVITAVMHLLPKNMLTSSLGLIGVATSLVILSSALKSMGGMSWEEIAKSLVTLAGSLTIIAVAMNFMTTALPGAAAMLVVAAAMAIFTPVLKALGDMSLSEIGKGLLALAGVFAVVGVAGLVLGPLTPVILGLSAAIALFGAGCVAVGAGVLAFSAGLSALAVSGTAGAAALVVIVTSIIGLIPMLLEQIGAGIVAFCNVIAQGAPAICAAITAVVLSIVAALTAAVPPLVECLGLLLTTLLQFIVSYVPMLVEAGITLILSLLHGIANNIQEVVETAIEIVLNFIAGVASKIPDIIQSGIDLVLSFINGMADGIRNNTDAMIAAVDNLMDAIIESVKKWLTHFIAKGKDLVGKLISGIKEKATDAKNAASNLIRDVVNKIKTKVSDFKGAAKDLVNGLINGIKSKVSDAVASAKKLASDVWNSVKDFLGIHSPSRKFIEVGKYCDEGLAAGLTKFAGGVSDSATEVGKTAIDSLKTPMSKISDIISDDLNCDPTIRPVVDLSAVQNGANQIGGMFANPRLAMAGAGINVGTINGNVSTLAKLMSQSQSNKNDNEAVVSVINQLREDVVSLGDAMSKMKVVMDSGATVGSLESEIDRRLGVRTTYKERWL